MGWDKSKSTATCISLPLRRPREDHVLRFFIHSTIAVTGEGRYRCKPGFAQGPRSFPTLTGGIESSARKEGRFPRAPPEDRCLGKQ